MECCTFNELFEHNKKWVSEKLENDSEYFKKLSEGQHPRFLFIGCSDSRVSISSIVNVEPGEIFIHRNIANQVSLTDMNFLSVLEYSVEVLKVEHIIVFGHYACGGVHAAVDGFDQGLIENWVSGIKDLALQHKTELDEIKSEQDRYDKLSEINAVQQVKNILNTPTMQRAMEKGIFPLVHAWIFNIYTGLIKTLELPFNNWKLNGIIDDIYIEKANKFKK